MSLPFDIPIAQLSHFVLVAETGNYRAAAAKAYRTQPALSLSIRELEQRLGQALFEAGSRATLTRFGEDCLPYARELIGHHHSICERLGQLARSESGKLVLASVYSMANHWLPDLIERYIALYPGIELHLLDDNSENVEKRVLAKEADFGICSQVSHDDRLQYRELIKDRFGLVCHRDHPLASRKTVRWNELKTLSLISTAAHRQLAQHADVAWLDRPHQLVVPNMLSLVAMLERKLGVTVLPRLGLPPFARELVFIPLVQPSLERSLGIVKYKDRSLAPPAQALENLILEHTGAGPTRAG